MSWDTRYMRLAEFIAREWSKDPHVKVGAVITKDNYPIGLGINGFPRGLEDSSMRLNTKPLKNAMMIHAELNALARAGHQGDTCYVTYLPCTACLSSLAQAGIKRIVTLTTPARPVSSKWNPVITYVMAKELGIKIETMPKLSESLKACTRRHMTTEESI